MTCKYCASEFETPARGSVTVAYCSPECRKQFWKKASLARYHDRTLKIAFICQQCGKGFVPKCSNRNQFCGRECARLAQGFDLSKPSPQRPHCKVYFPSCDQCGKRFAANVKTVRLCSDGCRDAERVTTRACRLCGVEFIGKQAKVFCSRSCKNVAYAPKRRVHSKIARRKRRALGRTDDHGKAYKRAKRYGVAYEVIHRPKVYERDRWLCKLCHKPIKKDVVAPHPLSATLDHIIPMAKGGAHLYSNVQTAHFRCNWMKGDKGQGEQLLLVG